MDLTLVSTRPHKRLRFFFVKRCLSFLFLFLGHIYDQPHIPETETNHKKGGAPSPLLWSFYFPELSYFSLGLSCLSFGPLHSILNLGQWTKWRLARVPPNLHPPWKKVSSPSRWVLLAPSFLFESIGRKWLDRYVEGIRRVWFLFLRGMIR